MEFSKIIAVSGKSGLFQVVSQSKNAVIAESLIEKKRIAINTTQNVSLLENISIYTYDEDMPLQEVFATIFMRKRFFSCCFFMHSNKNF